MKTKSMPLTIYVTLSLLLAGCQTETRKPVLPAAAKLPEKRIERTIQSATLVCKGHRGNYFGFYSFTAGLLPTPPADPSWVDLVYFFDPDDCSQGAIIGRDDRPGYLFPVGHRGWNDLVLLRPPVGGTESVAGIGPLTKDKEGLAFWVKARGGQFYMVRLATVRPVTYAQLRAGNTAILEIEWTGPMGTGQDSGYR